MKIISIAASFLTLQTTGASSATGMKPPQGRRGVVLAGEHRVHQHARRTTALVHSKGHKHHRAAKAVADHYKRRLESPLSSAFAPASSPTFNVFPCPSKDILDDLGLTAEEAGCDPNATFPEIIPDDSWLLEGDCKGPPPCPPKEILALLNLTLEELECDSEVTPPCPHPDLAGELGLDVASMTCARDFYCFSHQPLNANTSTPCSSDPFLFELELLYGVWCEFTDTEPWPGVSDIVGFNYTTLECPAPVPCSLPWAGDDAMGIVVCSGGGEGEAFPGFTMCIEPTEAFEGDTCGCCGGKCPEPCVGTTCKVPVFSYGEESDGNATAAPTEAGVWLVDIDGGYAQCVTSQESAFMQMDGYFTCMDPCSA